MSTNKIIVYLDTLHITNLIFPKFFIVWYMYFFLKKYNFIINTFLKII